MKRRYYKSEIIVIIEKKHKTSKTSNTNMYTDSKPSHTIETVMSYVSGFLVS